MADIKLVVASLDGVKSIVIRENIDRNGPGVLLDFDDKGALTSALAQLSNVGDEQLVPGTFERIDDTTNVPIAIFTDEGDADAFLLAKGAGHKKDFELTVDGFDFKILST